LLENVFRKYKRAVDKEGNSVDFLLTAKSILGGIELMHMIRNGQRMMEGAEAMSFADPFYALAGQIRPA